ncbi:MAG TPA: VOC family protein [Paludibaculum sp.]|jgi:catechol 2,3-dioxygenase-like lactoylglutathione lyase family enzyme
MLRSIIAFAFLVPCAPAQVPAGLDPGLTSIVQVAIVTKDIEGSAKRWASVLGMEVPKITTTRPGEEVKVVYKGKASKGQAKLAFFKMGQVVLELIEPVGNDTSWKAYLDAHGEGVQHLGFQVRNLDQSIANAQKAGMPVLHRGRYDKDNGDYVYLESEKALGVTLELLHSDPAQK